jgi:hypothetical protein
MLRTVTTPALLISVLTLQVVLLCGMLAPFRRIARFAWQRHAAVSSYIRIPVLIFLISCFEWYLDMKERDPDLLVASATTVDVCMLRASASGHAQTAFTLCGLNVFCFWVSKQVARLLRDKESHLHRSHRSESPFHT